MKIMSVYLSHEVPCIDRAWTVTVTSDAAAIVCLNASNGLSVFCNVEQGFCITCSRSHITCYSMRTNLTGLSEHADRSDCIARSVSRAMQTACLCHKVASAIYSVAVSSALMPSVPYSTLKIASSLASPSQRSTQ